MRAPCRPTGCSTGSTITLGCDVVSLLRRRASRSSLVAETEEAEGQCGSYCEDESPGAFSVPRPWGLLLPELPAMPVT